MKTLTTERPLERRGMNEHGFESRANYQSAERKGLRRARDEKDADLKVGRPAQLSYSERAIPAKAVCNPAQYSDARTRVDREMF